MFIIEILNEVLLIFLEMAPYLLLGLVFVALMNMFFSKDLIVKHVGKNNFLSILKAALLGVPLPLCSCGVIPSSVYMAKNGASKGATVSFLISTPQTGIDSIIATYGMLGWIFAIFRPIAALIMGIAGGLVVKFFDKSEIQSEPYFKIEEYKANPNPTRMDWSGKALQSVRYAFFDFLDDISVQFLVGIIISGLISYFIPEGFFASDSISNGIVGMLLVMLLGIPMYVCATASIPIAVTMMMKGLSPGVAFVFLVTGPATNAASLTIITNVLGKKLTAVYLGIIIIFSIVFGYLLNYTFYVLGVNPHQYMSHAHHEHSSDLTLWSIVFGSIFLILLILSFYRKFMYKTKKKETIVDTTSIKIEGMSCNHCVMNVKKAIEATPGVVGAEVVLQENTAYIKGDFDKNAVKAAIEAVGYNVVE